MEKDRAKRYQSASELQTDLEAFVSEHESAVMPYHMAQFMGAAFPPGTDKDRQTYQSLTGSTLTPSRQSSSRTGPTLTPSSQTPSPQGSASGAFRTPRSTVWFAVALLLIGAAAALVAALWPTPPPSSTREGPPRAVQHPVRVDARAEPRAAPRADMAISVAPDSRPARPVKVRPTHPRPASGFVWVDAPTPGEVLVGGKRLGELPLIKKPLPAGTHRLEVRSQKLAYSVSRQVTVRRGGEHKLRIAPGQGTIAVFAHPWAKVTLDGRLRGITPLQPIKAYEGLHVLVLENADLKVRQVKRVQLKPGQAALIKVVLE